MDKPLRIGLLAGESSGDILGAALIQALRDQYPAVQVEGIGGPLMEAQGLSSLFPMERLSVMGLIEPLKRLPELLGIRKKVFEHFRDNPPDVFVGIDSPDFNLHLEQKLRASGIKTAHLVSPSVWAWRQGRVKKIKRAVDLMLTLFPFEEAFYQQHQVPVCFVGHPLADDISLTVSATEARDALGMAKDAKVLALLPGSRGGEVALLAPLFFEVARVLRLENPGLELVLPIASDARKAQIQSLLPDDLPVRVLDGKSRLAMSAADAVLLASGTATLEALLLKKPMVIAYKMSAVSWQIISRMVRSPFVGLPNILANTALVPECLQGDANVDNIVAKLTPLLNGNAGEAQREAFNAIHLRLRQNAGQRAATALIDLAKKDA